MLALPSAKYWNCPPLPQLTTAPSLIRSYILSQKSFSGARVRQLPREEAEIAIECLRDWGISARIVENVPSVEPASLRGASPAVQ
jgi:hypothetical protein